MKFISLLRLLALSLLLTFSSEQILWAFPGEGSLLFSSPTGSPENPYRGEFHLKEKLRLRGIDAPERGTPEGKAAKKFVESETAQAVGVIVTPTKPDKYDRSLSDVFLLQKDGSEVFLNPLLLEKGFARRKDSFSFRDWGDLV